MISRITTRVLSDFNDPLVDQTEWDNLLRQGQSDVVFLTLPWQRAWWRAFAKGELLLIAAQSGARTIAAAPFFTIAGMVYLVGAGGSDYLDFVGDTSDPEVVCALLAAARKRVQDFVGFVFHHIPDKSRTSRSLQQAAEMLNLRCFDEGDLPAPAMDLGTRDAAEAPQKKSLLRHENYFRREGGLEVVHLSSCRAIATHLDTFFEQHVTRWAATSHPSLFLKQDQRDFYRALCEDAAADWLRFTRVNWEGRPIAFHFGFCYRGVFMWYKPAFAIDLARHSPGEVLLRQLFLLAMKEQAHTFDFGLGDEGFKSRFATRVETVRTWGLYTAEAVASAGGDASTRDLRGTP